ncbi:ABC transporter permease YtrF [Clostridiales bacterium]|nr:ABC transporter permease [Clostridiales bacterium]GFI55991.1 ABC transporter permease YtrF [Clostridiales bacterium]
MKGYLDLVPISAKVHKKQSRMSVFCIILSVFLVTAIFGMADMFIRGQILQAQSENGNWHIGIRNITDEDAAVLAARPDIKSVSPYGVLNFRGDQGYTLSNKDAAIFGSDEAMVKDIFDILSEGVFPQNEKEALVSDNAKETLGLKTGDQITVKTASGEELPFTISGFATSTANLLREDSFGVFLNTEGFRAIHLEVKNGNAADYNTMFYVQFANTRHIQNTIQDIKASFSLTDDQVSENTKLLGLLGQSSSAFMMQVYGAAIVLFILVLCAGILMITSSLNSNVAQRIEFFGLMRCVGATPKQVMRLVRKEALHWCRLAIPIGVVTGTIVVWLMCFVLKWLSPAYFGGMPIFSISIPSIIAGICVGLLTVLLAARSPAKKASKSSPLAAVSGNANDLQPVRRAANTKLFKVDTSLGIHHAKSSKKNFVLMVGSFSLSIILFLSFSVTIDFMKHTLTPLHPWTADLSIISPDQTCSVRNDLIEELSGNPAVDSVYGRMFAYNVPIVVNGETKTVDLITYEEKQFDWAKNYKLSGSLETAENQTGTALVVFEAQNTIQVGDTVTLHMGEKTSDIEIVGMVSDCPFNNRADVGKLICSEETFRQLTGESDYTIIDMQLAQGATENDVSAIRKMAGGTYTFSDDRMGNSNTRGTYYCFGLFVYGFLVLIALITIFNIINSIAMSVAARMKQYGAFRAIGLSNQQLVKMVVAEASTYAVTGCICGGILGLLCNKFLFDKLVGFHWGDPWSVPVSEFAVILAVVAVAVILAIRGPIKKIRDMSIVDTISAQ